MVKNDGALCRSALLRFGILDAEGLDRDLLHHLGNPGLVVIIGAHGADVIDGLNALDDLAEGGILPVQMGGVLMHDKELAAGGVGGHGAGHGENAAVVLEVVGKTVGRELALDAVAGAAGADALGVAALDHKAGDHAVEDQPVIEALLHQGDEIVDGVGGDLGIELGLHHIAVFHFKGYDRIAHQVFLSFIILSISRLDCFSASELRLS